MPATIYLITGGCRSGKSSYAQSLCEKLCKNPIYLATSSVAVLNADFEKRIQRHQDDRGPAWTTIEEPLAPSKHVEQFKGRAIMVDCLTLWLTNYFMEEGVFSLSDSKDDATALNITTTISSASTDAAEDCALTSLKQEFETLTKQWDATFVFVTNEIGSGTHAHDAVTRKFVDAQGWLNQHVAAKAKRVVHMVSGIPTIIKDFQPRVPLSGPIRPSEAKRDEAFMLDTILSARGLAMDSKGYFFVKVVEGLIVASFVSSMLNDKGEVCDLQGSKIKCCGTSKRPEPMKEWKCRTAKELTIEIFERWDQAKDIVTVGHAAYIGREAQRAEQCLYAGEAFQQN
jgi:adenosylcobinamide kinase/adenosylcobinamide-phosphate guanylyltransferase